MNFQNRCGVYKMKNPKYKERGSTLCLNPDKLPVRGDAIGGRNSGSCLRE
jgi:hypothetical protein